ncbi:hypothetical protein [Streptomyces anulatus]|uniref:hypothetical protein n=1 Tax=Streptomyces anulatus TaxID=1892 RepID=UPI00363200CC
MQTAVLDTADSEDPVECPTEAPEMLIFRREYLERTFWCGTWLGGCCGELTDRLCTDKVCHFAHKADPDAVDSPCRRRSGGAGIGSADHLYIKAALADWMASHNTPGGSGVGAPVPAATPRRRAAAKRSTPQPVPLARPRIPGPS